MRTSTEKKRQIASWLLLSVFLPMMALTVMHKHYEPAHAAIECQDCQHHLHHSHIMAAGEGIDHCVLCEMLSIPYLPSPQTGLSFIASTNRNLPCLSVQAIVRMPLVKNVPRAPPCIFLTV